MRITEYCDANRLTTEERLKLFTQVCEAVQHAHQKGIIHRDLKPSNVLVTMRDDKAVPKVIDFGIAKATGARLTEKTFFTGFNQIIGTPVYMSPEQAGLGSLDIDTRSDIYALGVILYELLTGRTPFSNEELMRAALDEILRTIREKDPPKPSTRLSTLTRGDLLTIAKQRSSPPGKLNRLLRGELDWIVMKCLDKDRTRRYETANELARDIEAHLRNEPVSAAAPSVAYQFAKFARRNRVALGTVTAFALVLLAATSVSIWQAREARRRADAESKARNYAQQQERRAEAESEAKRQRLVRVNVAAGMKLLEAGDSFASLPWFVEALKLDQGTSEKERMHRMRLGSALHYAPRLVHNWFHNGPVNCVEYSKDGDRVLTASDDGTARVWDVVSGRLLATLQHSGKVRFATFSPDGSRVATACAADYAQVWDWVAGKTTSRVMAHTGTLWVARFSPDGRKVLTASGDQTVRVWSAETGEPVWEPIRHGGPVRDASWSPDGRFMASIGGDGMVMVHSGLTGEFLHKISGAGRYVYTVSFSPDSQKLLWSSWAKARLHVAENGRWLTTVLKHDQAVRSAHFSPDGSRILTACEDQTVQLWDDKGSPVGPPIKHSHLVRGAEFSPDGRRIITASDDGAARIFDLGTQELACAPLKHSGRVIQASFSPDGAWVVTAGVDGLVRLWDVATRGPESLVLEHGDLVRQVVASPNSALVATASNDRTARLWDAHTGEPAASPSRHDRPVTDLVFSTDGAALATVSQSGEARLWAVSGGSGTGWSNQVPGSLARVAFAGGGRRLVAAGGEATAFRYLSKRIAVSRGPVMIQNWDAATGVTNSALITLEGTKEFAEFSPDGEQVATPCEDGTVRIWETATGRLVTQLRPRSPMTCVRFSPDGRRIALADGDISDYSGVGEARLWSVETGEPLAPSCVHRARVHGVAFSPDGRWNFNLTFTGNRHTPVLPPPMPCGCDQENLVSRQTTNAPSSFSEVMGFSPPDGTTLRRWSGSAYVTYTCSGGTWSPSSPVVNRGESVFVKIPCSNQCMVVTCATNKAVECGPTWDFDPPQVENSCCGTNFTISVLSTVVSNQGPCLQFLTRTWRISDCISNSTTCSQTVTVRDTMLPLVGCPTNLTVQCVSAIPARPATLAQFLAAGGSANDNCDTNLTYSCSDGPLTGGVCGGTVIRTHTVTDDCSNSASCVQIFTVRDTMLPLVVCPTNLTVQCVSAIPARPATLAQFLAAGGSASDNCDTNLTYSCNDGPLTGGVCGGTVIRTHTVTDDCTNSASCVQIFTVRDTIPPFVACPTNLIVQCVSAIPARPATLAQFLAAGGLASDNCDTNLTYSCSDGPLTGGVCGGTVIRTHTVTDDCTNSASCVQIFTVRDTIPPFVGCPANLIVQCVSAIPARPSTLAQFLAAGGSANDNCDTNLTYGCSDGPLTGGVCGGTVIRTHTVTDDCTNSASCVQIITVRDTIPPVLICATNKTVECGGTWTFDAPDAFDLCCTNLTYWFLGSNLVSSTPCQSLWSGRWQVSDCCSNFSGICTQLVTVVDTTPPSITCASNKTVECGTNWSFDIPTAVDNCDRFVVSLDPAQEPGGTGGTGFGTGNLSLFGNTLLINVTYSGLSANTTTAHIHGWAGPGTNAAVLYPLTLIPVGSKAGTINQAVTLVNGTGGFSIAQQLQQLRRGLWYINIHTTSRPGGEIRGQIIPDVVIAVVSTVTNVPSVPCPTLFSVTRTWQATDACTNAAYCSQTVTVLNTTPPIVLCPTNRTVECGSPWSFEPPLVLGGCCGSNVTIAVENTTTNGSCPQTVTRTWRISDCCTNQSACSQTITVFDPLQPVIVACALGRTNLVETNCLATLPDFTGEVIASDSSGPLPVLQSPPAGTLVGLGEHVVTFAATNGSGKSASCTALFRVIELVPPTIVCPTNLVVEATGTNGAAASFVVNATDNCTVPAVVECAPPSGSVFPFGTTVVVCTATDASSNRTSCSFTVTVRDTSPPIVRCLQDRNRVADAAQQFVVPDFRSLTVAADESGAVNLVQTPPSGTVVGPGVYPIQIRATDLASNSTVCTFTLTVFSAGVFAEDTVPVCRGDRLLLSRMQLAQNELPGEAECWVLYSTQRVLVAGATLASNVPKGRARLGAMDGNRVVEGRFIFPHTDHRTPNLEDVNPLRIGSGSTVFYKLIKKTPAGTTASDVRQFVMPYKITIGLFGDSYAAGEGAPQVVGRFVSGSRWLYPLAHRSKYGGFALAVEELKRTTPETAFLAKNVTCSGAGIAEGLIGYFNAGSCTLDEDDPARVRLVPQLDEMENWLTIKHYVLDDRPSLNIALMSCGGNDVKLPGLVKQFFLNLIFPDDVCIFPPCASIDITQEEPIPGENFIDADEITDYEDLDHALSLGVRPRTEIQIEPGGGLVVTWPEWAGEMPIESSTSLDPVANWQPLNSPTESQNGIRTLRITPNGARRFIRLKQP